MSDHPAPSNRKWKIALVAVMATAPLLGALGGAWAAQTFPDVPPSNIFYDEIEWGAANGIINGYTNGKFGPNDNVTRGQSAAFLSHYNDAIHTVTSISDPAPAANWIHEAKCPVGERAVAGVAHQSNFEVFLTDTYLDGRDFEVRWESDNNAVIDLTQISATAVCAPDSVANPVAAGAGPPAGDKVTVVE
jgi:hypothetical protein